MEQPQQSAGPEAAPERARGAAPGAAPDGAPGPGRPPLRVGMVGYAFMGAAHSQGWRTVGHVFDLPRRPVLAVLCGRDGAA
ncbi:gfo/Idh/MocA family oxidoreductase, partial [Streptomyces sp. NPDC001356]